jgi:hypothetical protein
MPVTLFALDQRNYRKVLWPFFIECHVGNDAMHEVLRRADARGVSLQ